MASFVLTVQGGQTTVVTLDGGFDVNGPLSMFANAGAVRLARVLMSDFAVNLGTVLAARRTSRVEEPDVAPPRAPQPDGLHLLGRVFVQWLRELFRNPGQGKSKP